MAEPRIDRRRIRTRAALLRAGQALFAERSVDGVSIDDIVAAAEIYKKANQLLYDEMPMIPIAHSTVTWPLLKKVQNFKLHPTASIRLKNVWLEAK